MESRVSNSIKNIKFSLLGQLFGIIISFISRSVFIKILSSEYLGLSGLFSNVLSILSLTEMGFGTAIAFELYKPLANRDENTINSLMSYYKKIYTTIGISVMILGLLMVPIYPFFIKDLPNISNLNLIFILFVTNSSLSYFLAYKRILLISDQKRYIETKYKYSCFFLLHITQIIVLLISKNYILFLLIQLLFTIIENVLISNKVDILYPYLKNKSNPIKKENKDNIFKNVKSMFFHKFGGVVLSSTDNLVTSKYIGLSVVGIYSNYFLITSALDKIISQIFTSLIASIGNLNVTSSRDKKTEIFLNILFVNFCIYAFVCCCLLNLLNPFISIWIGSEYLLNNFTVIIIVINIYIYGMRKTAMAFREATGNYNKDWFSPLIEALINVVVSIVLAKTIGLAGVFLGTIISSLCTNFWLEPFVVIKKSINLKISKYFVIYFKYLVIACIICSISGCICNYIMINNIAGLMIKAIISCLLYTIIITIIFIRDDNFIKIKNIVLNKIFGK